ncbi:uncharacterized protein [Trachinotus anak]|uniref:uncharacterized protein n=1 Tax=Trachinotus anak TaxID=443729 RepID=UPI0039F18E2D
MAKSGRKQHLSFSSFRRRQQAANNRGLCIIWINRMVNKQVERRIADLRSEFLFRHDALREEMTELREQLKVLVAKEAREKSLHYTKLDRKPSMTSKSLGKMEEHKKKAKEFEGDKAKLLNLETPSLKSSGKPSDTNYKPPKCEQGEILKILLDIITNGEISCVPNDADNSSGPLEETLKIFLDVFCDGEISSDSSDGDTSPQRVKFEQKESQGNSSDVSTVANTSQLKKDSEEEESSRNPFHGDPSFMTQELRCEVQVDTTKEEEVLLMERQWKEWLDKQEMRGNDKKVKPPVDQQRTEKQGVAAPPESKKQTKQEVQGRDTMMKIKTYFSDLKNPFKSHKWERLADED